MGEDHYHYYYVYDANYDHPNCLQYQGIEGGGEGRDCICDDPKDKLFIVFVFGGQEVVFPLMEKMTYLLYSCTCSLKRPSSRNNIVGKNSPWNCDVVIVATLSPSGSSDSNSVANS